MNGCPLDPRLFLAVALSGEQQMPGCPAVVWVDSENTSARYTLIQDLAPPKFKEGVQNMYAETGLDNFLIVHKESSHLHVYKFPKKHANHALAQIGVSSAPETSD